MPLRRLVLAGVVMVELIHFPFLTGEGAQERPPGPLMGLGKGRCCGTEVEVPCCLIRHGCEQIGGQAGGEETEVISLMTGQSEHKLYCFELHNR